MKNKTQFTPDNSQKETLKPINQNSDNPFDWDLSKIDITKIPFNDFPKTGDKILDNPYRYGITLQDLRLLMIVTGYKI